MLDGCFLVNFPKIGKVCLGKVDAIQSEFGWRLLLGETVGSLKVQLGCYQANTLWLDRKFQSIVAGCACVSVIFGVLR